MFVMFILSSVVENVCTSIDYMAPEIYFGSIKFISAITITEAIRYLN